MIRKCLPCISAGLLFLVLITGFILSSSKVSADVIDNVNVTVPASCSLSTNSGTGETYSVSMMPGQYKNDIGDTTISVFCNTNDTYAIYAIGYSNDTLGTTDMISSNTATTGDISTGTATNGSSSAWAMKLTPITGTYAPTIDNGFSNFSSVPSTYTKVASVSSAITPSTDIASVKATYAVYISPTQKVATYTGKVKYTIVNPNNAGAPAGPQTATSGCINYFPNGSGVVGTMGCQSISSSATTATLLASNFSRDGYGFAGWSNKYDYATNPNQEGIKFYGPQEDITFTAGQYTGTNDGLALYAVWIKSQGSLQDTAKVATLCGTGIGSLTTAPTDGTANLASVSALTDQRDNQTYAIAKLADGKCWMIENLRLESTNSDNSTGALAQGYGTSATYGNFSGLATAESANFSNSTTANSLYYSGTQDGTASIDIGTTNDPAYRMPRYNNANTSARASSPTVNTGAMYSYGNYYTWHAAIADTTYYFSGDHDTTSLCPTGWKLPYGNRALAGGFYNLNYKINNDSDVTDSTASKKIRAFPNNFLYSGRFSTSSAGNRGSNGLYWSSTAYVNNYSYLLYLDSSSVVPGNSSGSKYYGYSIRCTTGT